MSYFVEIKPTCTIKPCLNNKLVHCISVDDMGKAGSVEVASSRVDSHSAQVDVCFHRGESNVTKPRCENLVAARCEKERQYTIAL